MPKGYRRTEDSVVKAALKIINNTPGCYAEKRMAGAWKKGRPDITGTLFGRRLEMECKVGDNTPTPTQSRWLRDWRRAGAISLCVWSKEEVQWLVDDFSDLYYNLPTQFIKEHVRVDKNWRINDPAFLRLFPDAA